MSEPTHKSTPKGPQELPRQDERCTDCGQVKHIVVRGYKREKYHAYCGECWTAQCHKL